MSDLCWGVRSSSAAHEDTGALACGRAWILACHIHVLKLEKAYPAQRFKQTCCVQVCAEGRKAVPVEGVGSQAANLPLPAPSFNLGRRDAFPFHLERSTRCEVQCLSQGPHLRPRLELLPADDTLRLRVLGVGMMSVGGGGKGAVRGQCIR